MSRMKIYGIKKRNEDPGNFGDIAIASPHPPAAVGGDIFPVDKTSMLVPYIPLVTLLATAAIIKKRKR